MTIPRNAHAREKFSHSLAWLLAPLNGCGLEEDMFQLFGYLELLNDEQRARFRKSAKILQREAIKVFYMVRDLDEEADGATEICRAIRRAERDRASNR
jgi:hypothetical protein